VTEQDEQGTFRQVMGRFVTGVAVVTARDEQGRPHGMTANAVTSVSLDPLLVLFCVDRAATMSQVVQVGSGFALSFLSGGQAEVSERFADPARPYGEQEFDGLDVHEDATGAPLLDGAVGWLDCDLHDVLDGGDHLIVLGRVRSARAGEAGDALLYTPLGYDVWTPPAP